ncbi:HAD family hydrolase [Gracilimonas tropica]|uniref:HAD family hydrolase n=1 Tax=Gracilimonas tropica TaxID=454600 RepID=UPI00035FD0FB|nr:HAD family phosphatase [Gracilimonas tropica]
MQEIEAILFDMDGVIVHSNPIHKEILIKFCEQKGVTLTEKKLREKVYGRTNQDWIPNVFGKVSQETINAYTDEKEQMFRDVFKPKEHIVPGFIEFLDRLDAAGIKKVVATSAPAENADLILEELGITDRFDAVLNSSHVTKSKPDPEPYLKAARAVGVNPENCIVFEDSISGVQSGKNAGAVVVGVATTHSHKEMSTCALVIDDFEGLSVGQLEDLLAIKEN